LRYRRGKRLGWGGQRGKKFQEKKHFYEREKGEAPLRKRRQSTQSYSCYKKTFQKEEILEGVLNKKPHAQKEKKKGYKKEQNTDACRRTLASLT